MESQSFRYRDREAQRPSTPSTPPAHEEQRSETKATGAAGVPPSLPATPACQSLKEDARELGGLATLLQIAQSQRPPDAKQGLEDLRLRIRRTLGADSAIQQVSARTTLRDRITTTDSQIAPIAKWALVAFLSAVLAIGVYALVQWLLPAPAEPAAVAGAVWMTLVSL